MAVNYGQLDKSTDYKDEFIKEHKHLINVLSTGKGMKKEKQKQQKELNRMKSKY